jgi:hypothetical protein
MIKGAKMLNYMISFEGASGDPAEISMNIILSLNFHA